jgi:hypothetical protein
MVQAYHASSDVRVGRRPPFVLGMSVPDPKGMGTCMGLIGKSWHQWPYESHLVR